MKCFLLTIICLLSLSSYVIGQNKKEQIKEFKKRVDSLENIISEQYKSLNQLISYQTELKNNLDIINENFEIFKENNDSLKKKVSLYEEKFKIIQNLVKINSKQNSFIDNRDRKSYSYVQIGTQTWMSENLAYYIGKGCWAYNDETQYANVYGYLYDWQTAKNVCPQGWHLPSVDEFETLLDNVGGKGTKAFNSLIQNGESGFNAQFGGWKGWEKKYNFIGEVGRFWSSSEYDKETKWDLDILIYDEDAEEETANPGGSTPSAGFSVRCIKD